jgi:hypothetical protein
MITQLQLQLEVTDAEWVGQIGYRHQNISIATCHVLQLQKWNNDTVTSTLIQTQIILKKKMILTINISTFQRVLSTNYK